VLDDATRAREALELSLRTSQGVPAGTLDTVFLEGLVTVVGERIVLTRKGRLLANEVSLRLTP
jgi:coproporphyrinogen III oxidase-like Fe-S oxidoreductase